MLVKSLLHLTSVIRLTTSNFAILHTTQQFTNKELKLVRALSARLASVHWTETQVTAHPFSEHRSTERHYTQFSRCLAHLYVTLWIETTGEHIQTYAGLAKVATG